jgi:kinetochore protein Mis12/MTW1
MAATVKDTTLLPEILGFPPQLLLDDLVNIFNNCVYQAVEAIEVYLQHWADSKPDDANNDALAQEIELGLHAFQTLLESHADLAFDFFEIWALRNVFTIPEGLPIIVPHQDGLDLQTPVETEKELQIEVEELRHKVENVCGVEIVRTFSNHVRLGQATSRITRTSQSKLGDASRKSTSAPSKPRFPS